MLDKVALIVCELVRPVIHVLGQINLFRNPEYRHVLLVFGPEVLVLNGENHVAIGILLQKRLLALLCLVRGRLCGGCGQVKSGHLIVKGGRRCLALRRLVTFHDRREAGYKWL